MASGEAERDGAAAPEGATPGSGRPSGSPEMGAGTSLEGGAQVLLVDDDPTILRSLARALGALGYQVVTVTNGADAVARVRAGVEFDAIISDITMPGMDGLQLLREVREHDLYVPVVLMTGEPAVSTAVKAIEFGAFHYLTKPTSLEEVHRVLTRAAGLTRMARIKHEAAQVLGTGGVRAADRAGLEASFERALARIWMAYQPIVRADTHEIYAFEALVRCDEPALPNPGALIDAAERLGRVAELGRAVRAHVTESIHGARPGQLVFVNCHPSDLSDEALFAVDAPLTGVADRVVLEITERAGLEEVVDVRARVARLRELGFRIALDDFGAGYAGLTSFAQLEPQIVKMDLSIVRDVEESPIKQKLIRSMTSLAREMGILVVAEGVETLAERDALVELGVDLFQGFLFARPGRPFPGVAELPLPAARAG